MFGLMTKAEHERLMAAERHSADYYRGQARENQKKAMDYIVTIDDLRAEIRELQDTAGEFYGTIRELHAQIAANARYVEAGKARLATLERAKAKREGV